MSEREERHHRNLHVLVVHIAVGGDSSVGGVQGTVEKSVQSRHRRAPELAGESVKRIVPERIKALVVGEIDTCALLPEILPPLPILSAERRKPVALGAFDRRHRRRRWIGRVVSRAYGEKHAPAARGADNRRASDKLRFRGSRHGDGVSLAAGKLLREGYNTVVLAPRKRKIGKTHVVGTRQLDDRAATGSVGIFEIDRHHIARTLDNGERFGGHLRRPERRAQFSGAGIKLLPYRRNRRHIPTEPGPEAHLKLRGAQRLRELVAAVGKTFGVRALGGRKESDRLSFIRRHALHNLVVRDIPALPDPRIENVVAVYRPFKP